jgi:hypothetical protein
VLQNGIFYYDAGVTLSDAPVGWVKQKRHGELPANSGIMTLVTLMTVKYSDFLEVGQATSHQMTQ